MIKLVNSILGQAVAEGASDIHFEPEEGEMRVRFRVDGVLQETARVPKRMVAGVISRIKIMSELDIAEKRVPQDGRVSVTIEDRRDRPARHDAADAARRGRDDPHPRQGRRAAHARRPRHGRGRSATRFETSFRKPYGAVLVTGPTGSGKSTTLYAALQELNDVDKQHHHDRGPGRVPDHGHQPDQRQPQGRARPSPPACARSCAPTPT